MSKIQIHLKKASSSVDEELLNYSNSDVFTPDKISQQMAHYLHNTGSLLDPAVGTGNLLKFIDLKNYGPIDLYDIKREYLDQCPSVAITKYCADFLVTPISRKYDNIIMNPPYIRCQNLSEKYRRQLKVLFPESYVGNIDLYYFFILKCVNLLSDDGVCVMITPNSWLYNKSSLRLRQYLFDHHLVHEMIDFGSQKVFNGVSTYCCITVVTKNAGYASGPVCLIYNQTRIEYDSIIKAKYDLFSASQAIKTCVGKKLGEICTISNGIATLCDQVFIHENKLYEEPCWQSIYCGNGNYKWIIYPYDEIGSILPEDRFKRENPQTYDYLDEHQDQLNQRDKGKKTYATWYAYGRTQSIKLPLKETVIYMSLFADPKNIDLRICKTSLYKNCLCLCLHDPTVCYQEIIDSIRRNQSLIEQKSSKRGGGWINISTTTIKEVHL